MPLTYLVIDACVAKNAGPTSEIPSSKATRDLLDIIYKCDQYSFVISKEIKDEWNKHQTDYSRRWRVLMTSRKRIFPLKDTLNSSIRENIEITSLSVKKRREMIKDVHLIEAAILTHNRIISSDDKARFNFSDLSNNVGEIRSITWVNPINNEEVPIEWIQNGAPCEEKRKLGFKQTQDASIRGFRYTA